MHTSGSGSAKVLCAAALALLPGSLRAQAIELVRQGQWTVEAPQGGCGSLPLLQVKGPGTLFDVNNAAALVTLQGATATALAHVCPDVTEAIMVNGRGRRLLRLNQVTQGTAQQSPAAIDPSPSVPERRSLTQSTATTAGIPKGEMPDKRFAATMSAPPANDEPPPVFPTRRAFPSLIGVRGTRQKCDLLFAWLESSKVASPGQRVNAVLPAQVMEIFQDGVMTAVFDKSYDALGNSARIDLYEKTFSACTGEARRTPQRPPINGRPLVIGGISIRVPGIVQALDPPLPAEYRQQFAQYNQLLRQAFGGSPGRYEPSAVTAYVQQVREASQWANGAVSAAAKAPATLDAFRGMQESESQVGQKASRLTAGERDEVRLYLHRRETAIAPIIVKNWLAMKGEGTVDLPTAKVLVTSRAEVGGVLAALSPEERKQTDATYSLLLDRAIAPSLEAATTPLAALPASWQGAQIFASKETAFLAEFSAFDGVPSYATAVGRLDGARTRIFMAVLPEWRRRVAATHTSQGELLALRQDLRTLFVTPADRLLPLFQQFEEPVRQRQAQLDAAVQADEQRRLAQAERAAADEAARGAGEIPAGTAALSTRGVPDSAGPVSRPAGTRTGGTYAPAAITASKPNPATTQGVLHPGDLKAGSGSNAELLNAIYVGSFDKIQVDRSSTEFAAVGRGYVEGFSSACFAQLPSDRVQLTESECDGWIDTYRGMMLVGSRCVSWRQVPIDVWADPKLYAALNSNPIQQVGSAMRTWLDTLTSGGNPLTAGIGIAVNLVQTKADASQMVSQTGCTSPALKQFKKNLERFALGQGGLRLNGTVEMGLALLPPAPGTTYRDSDYGRLLDDMVGQQSRTWAMNRYRAGSVSGARVTKRDALGRPASVGAGYEFSSLFAQQQTGTVTLLFEEGRPHCLYFSDQPNVCRTPSNSLTSAYVRGEYR